MRPEKLYLTDILEAAEAINRFVSDIPFEDFIKDEMRQAATLQKLIVIGEAAARLPDEFCQKHAKISWQDIVGFRNFAIHEYFSVNLEIVWTTAVQDVPLLRDQVAEILPLVS
jgi:uncharacterized protein with HEPN domain